MKPAESTAKAEMKKSNRRIRARSVFWRERSVLDEVPDSARTLELELELDHDRRPRGFDAQIADLELLPEGELTAGEDEAVAAALAAEDLDPRQVSSTTWSGASAIRLYETLAGADSIIAATLIRVSSPAF